MPEKVKSKDYPFSKFHYLQPDYSKPVYDVPFELKQRIINKLNFLYGKDDAQRCYLELQRILKVYYAHKTPIMIKWEKNFQAQNRFTEKGFTLIELLVVAAILGILAAIVVPNVSKFLTSGETPANQSEVDNVLTAVTHLLYDANRSTVTVEQSDYSDDIASVAAGAYTLATHLEGAGNMKCEYTITNSGSETIVTQCPTCTGCS